LTLPQVDLSLHEFPARPEGIFAICHFRTESGIKDDSDNAWGLQPGLLASSCTNSCSEGCCNGFWRDHLELKTPTSDADKEGRRDSEMGSGDGRGQNDEIQ
uniref:PLAC8 family protein n=1 Tax=Caenorhabditis tropicalis TaxID=1561998 RepID=A0A1I7SYN6_9PELO